MNQRKLLQNLTDLQNILNSQKTIDSVLKLISGGISVPNYFLEGLEPTLPESVLLTMYKTYADKITEFKHKFRTISARKIFKAVENFIDSLNQFAERTGLFKNLIADLIVGLNLFAENFEAFITFEKKINKLVISANNLSDEIRTFKNFIEEVSLPLRKNDSLFQNEEKLSIYLQDEINYHDIPLKLKTISNIYLEVCYLLDVSTAEYPLRIIELEFGSIFATIAGYFSSIGFMRWLLTELTKFTYRHTTIEGKVKSNVNKLEFYEKGLEITKKLKEIGVNTQENEEKIKKGILTLVENTNSLIQGQSKIEIDDIEISIIGEWDKALKANNNIHLISDGEHLTDNEKPLQLPQNTNNTEKENENSKSDGNNSENNL